VIQIIYTGTGIILAEHAEYSEHNVLNMLAGLNSISVPDRVTQHNIKTKEQYVTQVCS
jgi:hypothetical protein